MTHRRFGGAVVAVAALCLAGCSSTSPQYDVPPSATAQPQASTTPSASGSPAQARPAPAQAPQSQVLPAAPAPPPPTQVPPAAPVPRPPSQVPPLSAVPALQSQTPSSFAPPQSFDMALTSNVRPRVGACTFDVTVTGPGGIPVADAEVTAEFFMPITPAMGKTSTRMASEGNGRYEAIGTLATAGPWKVTVTAKRGHEVLTKKTFDVVAKD